MELNSLQDLIGSKDDIAWWQMCVRATLIFLFGVILVRVAGKRVFGKWGAIDIILSIIIGSNLSRALTGTAPFVETLIATTLLVALHSVLTAAAVRMPGLGPLLKGQPARIIEAGRVDERALKRHGVGRHDLEEALRSSGVTDPGEVEEAWVERNGDISVVKR